MTKHILIFLLLLSGSSPVPGETMATAEPETGFRIIMENGMQTAAVSLRDIILAALKRNVNMALLDLNQQISREAYDAAGKDNNPRFSTSITTSRDISLGSTNLSGDRLSTGGTYRLPYLSFAGRDTTAFSTGLEKKDKLGIHYSLFYSKSYIKLLEQSRQYKTDPMEDLDTVDDRLHVDSVTAAINIPVMQDWGDINRLYEHRMAIELDRTGYNNRQSRLALIQKTANLYWELVRSRYNIEAQLAAVKLAEQLLEESEIRHVLGLIDKVGVKQSENQLVYVKQVLLNEQVRKKQLEDQLRTALNIARATYAFTPVEPMAVKESPASFDALIHEVYQNNQNLNLLDASQRMNELALKEMENRHALDLDITAKYQLNGYGEDARDAFNNISDTEVSEYQVGMRLNIPLFDKVTAQKINEYKLIQSRISLRIKDYKMQLALNLKNILHNLDLAREEIDLAKVRSGLLADIVYKETEKFKVGATTSYQVAQVQQDLVEAKKNEILSRVQYEKTYLDLLLLTERVFSAYDLDGETNVK